MTLVAEPHPRTAATTHRRVERAGRRPAGRVLAYRRHSFGAGKCDIAWQRIAAAPAATPTGGQHAKSEEVLEGIPATAR